MALSDALMPWGWHSADLWTNVSPGLHTMHRWLSVSTPCYWTMVPNRCTCLAIPVQKYLVAFVWTHLSFALMEMHWSSRNDQAAISYDLMHFIGNLLYSLFVDCVISFSSTSHPRCVGLLFVVWLSSLPHWTLRGMTSLWSVIL